MNSRDDIKIKMEEGQKSRERDGNLGSGDRNLM